MNYSEQISSIKNTIINEIVNDQDIVAAIDNPSIIDADDLIYHNVWNSWRIPETEVWKETHICVKCDIDNYSVKTDLVRRIYVGVLVMTHQDLQRTDGLDIARGCNRIDFIAQRIERLLNRSTTLGLGEATLLINKEGAIDSVHPCRELKFTVTGLNNGYGCV